MQAQNPEVSGDKATTPAPELRLVTVDQLKKIHRELDACQKVIWQAGCRPRVPGGFDPAYVTGAQEQLQVIEGLIAKPTGWTKQKPTTSGAYWVRGFRLGEPDSRPALVEVARDEDGALLCNMNEHNTNDETHQWSHVEDMADRFEWCGPLGVSAAQVMLPRRADVPNRIEGPSGETANLTSIKATEAYNRALDDVARLNSAGKECELAQALDLAVRSLDQLVPYLGKVPADVGLLNEALMAGRKALQGGAV